MLFVIGDTRTGNANHSGGVGRGNRFPWSSRAGLHTQSPDRTRGFAALSDEQGISVFAPAQGQIARFDAVECLRFPAVDRKKRQPIAAYSGEAFAIRRN